MSIIKMETVGDLTPLNEFTLGVTQYFTLPVSNLDLAQILSVTLTDDFGNDWVIDPPTLQAYPGSKPGSFILTFNSDLSGGFYPTPRDFLGIANLTIVVTNGPNDSNSQTFGPKEIWSSL